MKESIAIITARGGSKRIPRKNIKDFCGKPIIAYSIEAALRSQCFDEVMVSTDDKEIAGLSMKLGAKVPFLRSPESASDYASTVDALLDVLHSYQRLGREFRYLCCLYPTAPFVTAQKLRKAMSLLSDVQVYSVIPVVAFSFPPQRSFILKDGAIQIAHPEWFSCRSQDLETQYHDCGQYYCCNAQRFLECKSLIGSKTLPILTPEAEVQDIDTPEDWKLAEIKYRLLHAEIV